MDSIKEITSEPTKMFSKNPPNSIGNGKKKNPPISAFEHAELFAVINKSRLVNGWTTRTANELDATIRVWFDVFQNYKIPVSKSDLLYFRALDLRQKSLQNGKEPPMMNAELLAACWTGSNGLQAENSQWENQNRTKESDRHNINYVQTCDVCFDTGFAPTARTINGRQYDGVIDCGACALGRKRRAARAKD